MEFPPVAVRNPKLTLRQTRKPGRDAEPRLRLVGRFPEDKPAPLQNVGVPLTGPTDPRWVLAVRTADLLQGSVLTADRREKLHAQARAMGLTAFDASLVIAIVQDQARRGHAPPHAPTAGQDQLRMVPLPRPMATFNRRAMLTSTAVALAIGMELLLALWLWR
ncbi:MAG: hypothetical protein GC164_03785 [Phycisphaera sp.]|nr:hypothetical protein [Phycisphaera sp.]